MNEFDRIFYLLMLLIGLGWCLGGAISIVRKTHTGIKHVGHYTRVKIVRTGHSAVGVGLTELLMGCVLTATSYLALNNKFDDMVAVLMLALVLNFVALWQFPADSESRPDGQSTPATDPK